MTIVTDVSSVSPQTMDLRAQILAADDIPEERVDVPEWGVTLLVRGMTGGQRAELMQGMMSNGDGEIDFTSIYPDVIVKTVYDPNTGSLVFSDGDKGAIMTKAGVAVDRLASVGLRLSGMGGDKAVDEAGKDS